MIPSIASIVQTRLLIAALLRIFVVFLWLNSLAPIVYWITDWINNGGSPHSFHLSTVISFFVTSFAGIAVFVFAAPLSRVFVPLRFMASCPRCRYRLVGSQECRCPECGLPLPEELIAQISEIDGERGFEYSATTERARVLFGIGIGGIGVSALLIVVGLATEFASPGRTGFTSGSGFIVAFIGVVTLLCFLLLTSLAAKMNRPSG
ncbi:MAG: hypothetical protein ACIAQF_08750 [Phycisphaerales bacterium JB065]